jgi:hypothetical protein
MGMDDRLFDEKLAQFKSDEKPEVVLLLGDDADLVRITVAWTNTTTARTKRLASPPKADNENGWWDWLWDNTTYSRQELMEKACQSFQGFDLRLRSLIGNRILYPDGSINSFAQRYLRERVLKLFQAKPPSPRTKRAKPR